MQGWFERLLLGLAAAATAALGMMIAANVVARALLGVSLPDTVVLARELMVAAILFPLAAATAARAHVCVEFVSDRMGARARSWLIVFGSLIGLLALTPMIWAGWRELAHHWSSGGFFYGDLNLPKWPGRLFFLLGIAACWLRLAELFQRDLRAVLRGEAVDDAHIPIEVD